MNATHTTRGRTLVIALDGEMIAGGLDDFQRLVRDQLAQGGRDLVIDASRLAYIDGEGIEALLWAARHAARRLGRVRVVGLTQPLHHIFLVARLEGYFPTYATVEEALDALHSKAA